MNRKRSFSRSLGGVGALLAAMLMTLAGASSAMAAITAVSDSTSMTSPTSGNAASSLSIPMPTGVVAGDFLLAQITYEKGSAATVTAPSGWTRRELTTRSSDLGQAIYYRAAGTGEPASYSWGFSEAVKAAGGIIRFTGVDTANAIINSSFNSGDSGTLTAKSIDALADSMLVAFFGIKKKDTSLSTPAGMTEIYLYQNPQDVRLKAARETRTTDGATGDRTSTPGSGDKWVAHLVALRATPTNSTPLAHAGLDQTVSEGASVQLDGSGSSDPDGDSLTYAWTQLAGSTAELSSATAVNPTFTAPAVGPAGETLTFSLVVSDGKTSSAPDTVDIRVSNENRSPIAVATADPTEVNEGGSVNLDGTSSYDLDDDTLTYVWLKTAGPEVTYATSGATSSFTAPTGSAGATFIFALTVSDGVAEHTASVEITVLAAANRSPTANAGLDQTVYENRPFSLAGSYTDPDGDTCSYSWAQLSGSTVTLSDATVANPSFTAPSVGSSGEKLKFRLTVDDGRGGSDSDEVEITVQAMGDGPNCSTATVHPDKLWPPNHGLVKINIGGLGDAVIAIEWVTQDEPVDGLGDGDTDIDAFISDDLRHVSLRAERSGKGNGRVYEISFTATNSGGSCPGTVKVCVPHNNKNGNCVDDGQEYDSF